MPRVVAAAVASHPWRGAGTPPDLARVWVSLQADRLSASGELSSGECRQWAAELLAEADREEQWAATGHEPESRKP